MGAERSDKLTCSMGGGSKRNREDSKSKSRYRKQSGGCTYKMHARIEVHTESESVNIRFKIKKQLQSDVDEITGAAATLARMASQFSRQH